MRCHLRCWSGAFWPSRAPLRRSLVTPRRLVGRPAQLSRRRRCHTWAWQPPSRRGGLARTVSALAGSDGKFVVNSATGVALRVTLGFIVAPPTSGLPPTAGGSASPSGGPRRCSWRGVSCPGLRSCCVHGAFPACAGPRPGRPLSWRAKCRRPGHVLLGLGVLCCVGGRTLIVCPFSSSLMRGRLPRGFPSILAEQSGSGQLVNGIVAPVGAAAGAVVPPAIVHVPAPAPSVGLAAAAVCTGSAGASTLVDLPAPLAAEGALARAELALSGAGCKFVLSSVTGVALGLF